MAEGNYDKILERIAKSSGVDKEEIERKVEAKRAKLSGLISKEGAAQVIAAELGISFDEERFKIDELLPGMKKANFIGKVVRIFPVRTFTQKSGDEGKVVNLIVADDTNNTRVVLWDMNHIDLVEKGSIAEESVVEVDNARVREGEVHLGSFSEIKLSNEQLDDSAIKREKPVKEEPISDFNVGDSVKTRAFIVQAFPPKFFYVCPQCNKKVNPDPGQEGVYKCQQHGQVTPEKRALMNFTLDDGTDSIRAVAFHETLQQIGFDTSKQEQSQIQEQVDNLLGKEMFFSGNIRNNRYFNRPEFTINQAEEVDVDKLIAEFEGSSSAGTSSGETQGSYSDPVSGSTSSSTTEGTSDSTTEATTEGTESSSSENASETTGPETANNEENSSFGENRGESSGNESAESEEQEEEEVEVQKF